RGISIGYQQVLNYILNPLIGVDEVQRNSIYREITEGKKSQFLLGELTAGSRVAELTFSPYEKASRAIRNFGSMLLIVSEKIEHLRKLESLLIAEAIKSLNILSDNFEELEKSSAAGIGSGFVFRTIRKV